MSFCLLLKCLWGQPQNPNINTVPISQPINPTTLIAHEQQQSLQQTPQPPSIEDSQFDHIIMIYSIASPDLNAALHALSLISGALASGRGAAMHNHEPAFLMAVAAQLRRLRNGDRAVEERHPAYKILADSLNTFYTTAGCGSRVDETAVQQLLKEVLLVIGAGIPPDAEQLYCTMVNVCVTLLEHSPSTALLCAVVALLHESIGDPTDTSCPRYKQLLLKCFWRSLKMMDSWDAASISFDEVLYKTHLFLEAYPPSFWNIDHPDMSDMPYRTVKTLVYMLVKIKGMSITTHLSLIPNLDDSHLFAFILKVFKALKLNKEENTQSLDDDAINNVAVHQ